MNSEVRKQEIQSALRSWYLTGATASGKTCVGIEMAKRLNAEIISLDSMAIYRGMDVGTAKPTIEQRDGIRHHLLDIVDPVENFSVSQYRDLALQTMEEIRGRGKEVLVVGGTALYLKALLRGLFDGPPADWEFRQQIEQELVNVDSEMLHQRLANVDPVAAHKLHPNDRRRIIRALEVFKSTGTPISHWQMEFDNGRSEDECRVFSIRHARPELHFRIEQRVEQMFKSGLVEEVRQLLEKWHELGQTAAQAVGYEEVIAHLHGEMDLPQTFSRVLVRTRKFARHQETWFRGLSECRMVDLPAEFDAAETADRLIEIGNKANLEVS
jgi:tRNA dimethylallyltransferase